MPTVAELRKELKSLGINTRGMLKADLEQELEKHKKPPAPEPEPLPVRVVRTQPVDPNAVTPDLVAMMAMMQAITLSIQKLNDKIEIIDKKLSNTQVAANQFGPPSGSTVKITPKVRRCVCERFLSCGGKGLCYFANFICTCINCTGSGVMIFLKIRDELLKPTTILIIGCMIYIIGVQMEKNDLGDYSPNRYAVSYFNQAKEEAVTQAEQVAKNTSVFLVKTTNATLRDGLTEVKDQLVDTIVKEAGELPAVVAGELKKMVDDKFNQVPDMISDRVEGALTGAAQNLADQLTTKMTANVQQLLAEKQREMDPRYWVGDFMESLPGGRKSKPDDQARMISDLQEQLAAARELIAGGTLQLSDKETEEVRDELLSQLQLPSPRPPGIEGDNDDELVVNSLDEILGGGNIKLSCGPNAMAFTNHYCDAVEDGNHKLRLKLLAHWTRNFKRLSSPSFKSKLESIVYSNKIKGKKTLNKKKSKKHRKKKKKTVR